ncbi:MAG: NEAT domain-containing protein [Lachnospiraceae bacterium]
MEKNVTGRKRKWQVYLLAGVVFSAGLISPMFPAKTMQVYAAETESVQAETIADGTYTINGVLRHAVQDQDSMGNTAISKPMTLQVSGGNCQLVLDLVPLTIRLGKKDFNGYLAEMLYYPDVDGRVPTESDAASGAEILEQYDGVYDSYNDPENGLDENVKGMIYPKKIAIPVTEGDGEIWTQVYVPVMEAVSAGSGEQYARLQLDWSSLTPVSKPTDPSTEPSTETPSTGQPSTEQPGNNGNQNPSSEKTDKSGLHTLLLSATSLSGRENVYTKESLEALKKAIAVAQNVYDNENATKLQITKQQNALSQAIINLDQKKTISSTEDNSGESLDIKTLSDGVYYLPGKMMKIDKQSLSMANEALDHTVKLTVKKKKYTLTLSFNGLTINGQKGYLGWLKYYKVGYRTDTYGGPVGNPKVVDVTKKQNGTDYPKEISFTMIAEAKKDGYVPLQVFVPVMDAISAGSGIQNVYLKLDLESITQDQNKVKETEDNGNSGSGTGTGNGTQGSRTNGTIGSKTAASGNGSAGSSLGNQSLPGSSQTKGTSTLLSSDASKKTKDAAKSSKDQKDSEAAKEEAVLKNKIEDTAGQVPSVNADSQQPEDTKNGDTVTTGQGTSGAQSKKGNPAAAALPSLGALLAAGAGVLYKIRSRRWVL